MTSHTNAAPFGLDIFWHEDVLRLDTGSGVFEAPASPLLAIQTPHPEGPDRILNIKCALEKSTHAQHFAWHTGGHATQDELLRFHTPEYLAQLCSSAQSGRRFTSTTVLSAGSWQALTAATGTTIAATRHILTDGSRPAFALVRPPGHHAAPGTADGYCFLNHVAVAAADALAHGLERIAIIDWDVHHGNGTQEGFYERADVLTVSLHMDHGAWGPSHPQTGGVDERGHGAGLGYNLNVPLPMGSGDKAYLLAFDQIVAPRVVEFRPQLLIIASGVDAGQFDPNGRQLLTTQGFHALGARARRLAEHACGRLVVVQEGGYNPAHSAFCALAVAEGVAGLDQSVRDPLSYMPEFEDRAQRDVAEVLNRLRTASAAS